MDWRRGGRRGVIIDLSALALPDCEECDEPSRRIVGKTFDVEGPGRVGRLYRCDRPEKCDAVARYLLRMARSREAEA